MNAKSNLDPRKQRNIRRYYERRILKGKSPEQAIEDTEAKFKIKVNKDE